MAKMDVGPAPRLAPAEGPAWYCSWEEEFNSRASWGVHPASHHAGKPQREYHIDDHGPWVQQGHGAECHPGDA